MSDPDVVVLRQKIHGMDAADYAEILRNRLPDRDIALATTPAEERAYLQDARVATGFNLSEEQLEIAENLELFACVYAGTGHLDQEAFDEHDVAVTNASGVHAPNISEYVVGSMIAFARRFSRAHEQQQDREWRAYPTRELHGSTAAVVGLGAIGTAVVDRLSAFEMDTVGVRYTPEKGGPTNEVYGFDEIHDAVRDAEFVVLACPLSETTEGLVDEDLFRTMPGNAILVNVARGQVVDSDALLSALRSNAIRGAALDVTDPEPLPENNPLWGMSNVRITPHNAGHTPEYFDRCGDILVDNLERLETAPESDLVNQVF